MTTSPLIKRNNIRLSGDGEAMIFAHGFGCDQNMWRFVAPAFESDHRVVLFDYVGAGKSDLAAYEPQRYATLDGYALDIIDIVEELDLRDVVLVGHSVSGMIGALAALRRPGRFARLVMLAPSPCYVNHPPDYVGGFELSDLEELLDLMDKNYLGWANFLAPLVMKNSYRPELAAELEVSFCSTDPQTAREFAKATFLSDYRHVLPELRTPTLVVQCADDAIAPPEVGQFMHDEIPHSALEVMDVSGHCPHLSAPGQTIEVIRRYLAEGAG